MFGRFFESGAANIALIEATYAVWIVASFYVVKDYLPSLIRKLQVTSIKTFISNEINILQTGITLAALGSGLQRVYALIFYHGLQVGWDSQRFLLYNSPILTALSAVTIVAFTCHRVAKWSIVGKSVRKSLLLWLLFLLVTWAVAFFASLATVSLITGELP